jgi:dUTP pyrophosphatase
MIIKIKRIDTSLPLPEYQTSGSVAFDLYSRIDITIHSGDTKLLPTNFIIETPKGYMLMLTARSSLAKKKGLKMANGVGTIDQDYCGEDDEIKLLLHNYTKQNVKIKKGERLAQGLFVKIDTAQWEEVEKTNNTNRGGFGSTGS